MNCNVKTASVLAVAMLLCGCLEMGRKPLATVNTSEAEITPKAEYLSEVSVKAVHEGEGETAVESALIWSEKYAEAVERLVRMQQENRQLAESNRKQTGRISDLRQELAQCQKELAEANAMLIEMGGELEKWKANVLGFRQEMRKADEVQLIALYKVLRLLGGEIPEVPEETSAVPTASAEDEGTTQ